MCAGVNEGRSARVLILAATGICRCNDAVQWSKRWVSAGKEGIGMHEFASSLSNWRLLESELDEREAESTQKKMRWSREIGHSCLETHANRWREIGPHFPSFWQGRAWYLYGRVQCYTHTVYATQRG